MSDDLFDPDPEETRTAEDFRAKYEKEAKARAKAEREAEELRTYKAENEAKRRESTAAGLFKDTGLDPSWSRLFLKDNPDVTEFDSATVTGWAQRYNLAPKPPETEQVEDTPAPPPQTSFAPQVQGGTTKPASISRDEFNQMVANRETHQEALDYFQRGLVTKE